MIRKILHLEGFAIFLFAVYLFYRISGDWLLFVILLAHVGMDRFLGFGLKYPTHFKQTHLQKL
ncbi:MAG: DUF4260 family protein [Candidatus Levybacteria bacterium]|nr:DUF4260 family protein [Candidatus Levybacteria bacterium]